MIKNETSRLWASHEDVKDFIWIAFWIACRGGGLFHLQMLMITGG
jgi:hypothetical protein